MSKLTSSFLAHEIAIISQNLEVRNTRGRISAQYAKNDVLLVTIGSRVRDEVSSSSLEALSTG